LKPRRAASSALKLVVSELASILRCPAGLQTLPRPGLRSCPSTARPPRLLGKDIDDRQRYLEHRDMSIRSTWRRCHGPLARTGWRIACLDLGACGRLRSSQTSWLRRALMTARREMPMYRFDCRRLYNRSRPPVVRPTRWRPLSRSARLVKQLVPVLLLPGLESLPALSEPSPRPAAPQASSTPVGFAHDQLAVRVAVLDVFTTKRLGLLLGFQLLLSPL
jgi:hypothetical protein